MVRLFSPSTRYQDIIEGYGHLEEFRALQEVKLDASIEELLSADRAFTYTDLCAMLGDETTVAGLTPHAGVARLNERAEYGYL
jgi:hypothetical protein